MALLKNSIIVAGWTMVSRFLGFARDLLIANKLGAGVASDAFFIALMLPNLLRRLLGEGAFNVAFVPLLADEQAKSHAAAKLFAEVVLGWMLLILTTLSVLGVWLMPWIVGGLVSGWIDDPERFNLTVALGRITFPYLAMICLAAFMGAVCNTAGRFAAYAMVPSFLNLAFIIGLFAFPIAGLTPAEAAAWSVPLGGIAQVAYMVWEVRRAGYKLRLIMPTRHPLLKPLLIRMGPAAVGVGVLQLSLVIDNVVASWVGGAAVSFLSYANRFYQFPLSLIGIAVATVLLPHLATLLGQNNKSGASQSFMGAFLACLTLAMGATAGLLVLAEPMMHTLLGHGAMTHTATQAVAWAMMGYVIGLPSYILTKVTAPAFFAAGDTLSPVKAGAAALVVNVIFNVGLAFGLMHMGYGHVAHVGIALATALGGYTNAALQMLWLRKQRLFVLPETPLVKPLLAMVGVGAATMAALVIYRALWPYTPDAALLLRLVWLAVGIGLGGLVFATSSHKAGLINLMDMLHLLRRRKSVEGV